MFGLRIQLAIDDVYRKIQERESIFFMTRFILEKQGWTQAEISWLVDAPEEIPLDTTFIPGF